MVQFQPTQALGKTLNIMRIQARHAVAQMSSISIIESTLLAKQLVQNYRLVFLPPKAWQRRLLYFAFQKGFETSLFPK